MNLRLLTTLSALVLVVAACGTRAEPALHTEAGTPPTGPAVEESPLSPPPTPTRPEPVEQSRSPIAVPFEAPSEVVEAAREHVATQMDISTEAMEVVATAAVEWSDASLGCPDPGKLYAQVITPGYRIILEVEGREIEVHTDQEGRNVVICNGSRDR